MTSAPKVRLLVFFFLMSGLVAGRSLLIAQDQAAVRQYAPNRLVPDFVPDEDVGQAFGDADNWWDISAYVSIVDGDAELIRAGDATRDFAQVPLEAGDTVRTARGRVELLLDDGSVVSLDEYTTLTVDSQQSWRLQGGRVKLAWRGGAFAVDASPTGMAHLRGDGDYWVRLAPNRRGDAEAELAVTSGSAALENALGRTQIRPGTRALTTAVFAPSVPYAFSAPADAFERWATANENDRYGVESANYLPTELRAYGGAFDRDGYWSQHQSYGWVWYPRVSVGWQPYYGGRWSFIANFGYSWVGGARWEWPAYHYGQWDRRGTQWFWVPSRNVQHRRVGYAAPRRSVTTSVAYYSRRTSTRSGPSRGSQTIQRNAGGGRNTGRRDVAQQPRAVPRSGADTRAVRPSPSQTRQSTSQARPQQARHQQARPLPATRQGQSTPPATRRPSSTSRPSPAASSSSRTTPSPTRQAPAPARQRQPSARPATTGSRSSTSRSAPRPAPRSGPTTRPSQPQRSAPSSARTPSRSAPTSGSRTPSAGSRSSGSGRGGQSSRSGTATRRSGRGGGG